MKTALIWIVAVALAAIPVGWLALRNPRAIPIGALLVAFVVLGYFGALGIAGGGYNPETRPAQSARTLGVILAVIAVLAVASLVFMKGSIFARAGWATASVAVWTVVALVLYGAALQANQVSRDAANEAYLATQRELRNEIAARRAALDQSPEGRPAVLDTAMAWLTADVTRRYEKLERVLSFGDPVSSPGRVVVWGVLTLRPEVAWERFGFEAAELHWQLNEQLKLRGYPERIALGLAPTADVDRAGGDAAYFGREGEKVIPQYGPDFHSGPGSPPFGVPTRR